MESDKDDTRSHTPTPLRPVTHNPQQYMSIGRMGMDTSSSESGSNSDDESDASEMEVDVAALTAPRQPREMRRMESNYSPPSAANESSGSESESESGSDSDGSHDSTHRFPARERVPQKRVRILEDDSDSGSNPPIPTRGPLAHRDRKFDGGKGFGIEHCPPRRKAARTVNYSEFYQSDESDSDPKPAKWRQRANSDSEFEASASDESEAISESISESSEEEYLPGGGRKKQGRRKGGRGRPSWGDDWDSWRPIAGRKPREEEDSDSDYLPGGKRRTRGTRLWTWNRRNEGYFNGSGRSGGSSSESERGPGGGRARRRQPTSDFLRMTSRRKEAISYKESSGTDSEGQGEGGEWVGVPAEEDNREAIERVLKKRIGKVGDTGNKTTIYAVQVGGSPNVGAGPGEATEVQYLIKWVNWSHLHNTWETEESLLQQNLKGMKRFYNFLRREEERLAWEQEANPEDIEYVHCREELQEQLLEQFTHVERIIAARESEEGSAEYLCKWRGLPYSECTWEDGALTSRWFQDHIDAFIERNNSDCIPSRNAKVLRHRPKFAIMRNQLSSLGGPAKVKDLRLRDYQLDGVNWLTHSWCKGNSVILADEMGLGKTIQTIAFLHYLRHEHQLYGPFLLVVPLSTMPSWQREFELWAPEINVVTYIGDISSRDRIREYEWAHPNHRLKFNALLTTFEILLKDKEFLGSVGWAVLIVDEAHRLKNDDSLLYRTLMGFRTNHRLLITGTPLQNSLKELWSLLHFIMDKKFSDWEAFEAQHRVYGEGDASNLSSLHQQLQPFLLRRVKKDVEKSLPAKVERILRVEMSSVQKQYYRWILTKNYKALSKGVKGSITGFINIMMELKKCCNHTWIVRSPDEHNRKSSDRLQTLIRGSGKLFLLDKLLVRLRETGHRVLIFSQMVRMLDVLAEYMELRRFPFQRLDGSIRGDQRKDAIDNFNAEGSMDFCFLLSTRAGGLGVNLATADTVVIFDSDWNPQNDLQAQARAHRIGQKNQVNIYRLVTRNSIEEDIVERAKKKMVLDHLVIQQMDTTGRTILSQSTEPSRSIPFDKEDLSAILKFGTEELFKEGDGEGDRELQEMDIDEILRRAETQSVAEDKSAANELLSQFSVASFALDEEDLGPPSPLATPTEGKSLLLTPTCETAPMSELSWEEIIPEVYRLKFEEEEKTREQLQLYLPPRQRTVQNYCEDSPMKTSRSRRQQPPKSQGKGRKQPSAESRRQSGPVVVTKSVRGFTDYEIRRFVKSYRKFANPESRLDAIAADAELQEKSPSDLGRLMEAFQQGCLKAQAQQVAREQGDLKYDSREDKGPMLQLSGVAVGVSSILKREEALRTLASCLPSDPEARKRYRMVVRAKPVAWPGVKWTGVDDSKLLIGVYEHGFGNWENVRNDTSLGLSSKILPAEKSVKPQGSHLQTRVEYLLKLLHTQTKQKRSKAVKPQPSSRKGKVSKHSEKAPSRPPALTVNIPRDLVEVDPEFKEEGRRVRKRAANSQPRKSPAKKARASGGRGRAARSNSGRVGKGRTVNSGEEEDFGDANLNKAAFEKCKRLLRPVKKCLNDLSPSEELSTQENLDLYKKALVQIGNHITVCLSVYKREKEVTKWKSNLWVFVSKFTSASSEKLQRVYKKAKRETEKQASSVMPVKKRYLEAASHEREQTFQYAHHTDSHSHRDHYDPGYRDKPNESSSDTPQLPSETEAKQKKH